MIREDQGILPQPCCTALSCHRQSYSFAKNGVIPAWKPLARFQRTLIFRQWSLCPFHQVYVAIKPYLQPSGHSRCSSSRCCPLLFSRCSEYPGTGLRFWHSAVDCSACACCSRDSNLSFSWLGLLLPTFLSRQQIRTFPNCFTGSRFLGNALGHSWVRSLPTPRYVTIRSKVVFVLSPKKVREGSLSNQTHLPWYWRVPKAGMKMRSGRDLYSAYIKIMCENLWLAKAFLFLCNYSSDTINCFMLSS